MLKALERERERETERETEREREVLPAMVGTVTEIGDVGDVGEVIGEPDTLTETGDVVLDKEENNNHHHDWMNSTAPALPAHNDKAKH